MTTIGAGRIGGGTIGDPIPGPLRFPNAGPVATDLVLADTGTMFGWVVNARSRRGVSVRNRYAGPARGCTPIASTASGPFTFDDGTATIFLPAGRPGSSLYLVVISTADDPADDLAPAGWQAQADETGAGFLADDLHDGRTLHLYRKVRGVNEQTVQLDHGAGAAGVVVAIDVPADEAEPLEWSFGFTSDGNQAGISVYGWADTDEDPDTLGTAQLMVLVAPAGSTITMTPTAPGDGHALPLILSAPSSYGVIHVYQHLWNASSGQQYVGHFTPDDTDWLAYRHVFIPDPCAPNNE